MLSISVHTKPNLTPSIRTAPYMHDNNFCVVYNQQDKNITMSSPPAKKQKTDPWGLQDFQDPKFVLSLWMKGCALKPATILLKIMIDYHSRMKTFDELFWSKVAMKFRQMRAVDSQGLSVRITDGNSAKQIYADILSDRYHEYWYKDWHTQSVKVGPDSEHALNKMFRVHSQPCEINHWPHALCKKAFNETLLIYAIKKNSMVDIILGLPWVDINFGLPNGGSPLYIACEYDRVDIVEKLMQRPDLEVDASLNNGYTPFLLSCSKSLELVKLLLPKANVAHHNNLGESALFIAVQNNKFQVANLLLERDNKLSTLLTNGGTSVLDILCKYDGNMSKRVKLFEKITEQPLIRQLVKDGWPTPLVTALNNVRSYPVDNGHYKMACLLLDMPGIDVNQVDEFGNTPLIVACTNGGLDMVERLLKMPRIGVNDTNILGNTALIIALTTSKTNINIIGRLLQYSDTDPNICGAGEGFDGGILHTPLIHAILQNNTKARQLLMGHSNIDVNRHDSGGYTVLVSTIKMMEPEHSRIDDIETLLNHRKIDINLGCLRGVIANGVTPLGVAMITMNKEVTKRLLDDPRIEAEKLFVSRRRTLSAIGHLCVRPIDIVYNMSDTENMFEYVLKMPGININAVVGRKTKKNTLLHTAIAIKQEQMVEIILNHGDADVNVLDCTGRTPLNNSCLKYETTVVRLLLLQDGIDINLADNNGMTPLCNLCSVLNEQQDDEERTASHNIIHRLMEKGVNVNQTNNEGMTPLDFVVLNNRGSPNDIGFHQWTSTSPSCAPVNIATLLWNHGGRQGIPRLVQKGLKRKQMHEKILENLGGKSRGGGAGADRVRTFLNTKKCGLKF